jgi:hypothetical protein
MSNFTLIQQPNNTYLLKFDMGLTCYKGAIYQNTFPEELQNNYINVVNEEIQYFLNDSPNDPKIVSMFEFPNTYDTNYFLISFHKNDQFVKYQRYIKIEMQKINKTIDDYLFEFDQRISTNKNSTHNQKLIIDELNKKFEIQETEIKILKDTINQINEKLNNLIIKQTINQPQIDLNKANTHNPFVPQQNLFFAPPKNNKIEQKNKGLLDMPFNSSPNQGSSINLFNSNKNIPSIGFIFNDGKSQEDLNKNMNNDDILFPNLVEDKKII